MRRIALLLLLAVPALCAQVPHQSVGIFKSTFEQHVGIAAILLAISIMLTGAIYAIGNFLMNDKVKGWAKTEAVEIFYSGVILAIIVGICVSADEVAKSLTYQIDGYSANVVCSTDIPQFNVFTFEEDGTTKTVDSGYANLSCHMRVAKNFLASIFYETAGLVKAVGITHSWYIYLSSFSVDFTPIGTTTFFSGASFSHSILGFLNAKNNALSFMFDTGVKALTIIRFQEVLINFIGVALFPILLAAGIILRTFMLTRRLGGLLMAIALSIYFVYPMFYVLGDAVYNSVIIAQGYDPAIPPQNKAALAHVFMDLDALPKKISGEGYSDETKEVKTDGTDAALQTLNQLGLLTATERCKEVNEEHESAPPDSLEYWLDYFGSENSLLSKWLSDSYAKGGIGGFQGINMSFKSILVGMDALAKALFFSVFFSFLSVFATIAAIKTLSPMLGGDVEIAGLTHLI